MNERLTGTVATITHHNAENGFFVAKVEPDTQLRGMPLVPVLGFSKNIYPGEAIEAAGKWERSMEWGHQFKASSVVLRQPTRAAGILRYLQSGAIKGIGKEIARRIVERFGDATFEVFEKHPERLSEVKGLGGKRLAALAEAIQEGKGEREILAFLQAHNISASVARRIHEAYGAQSVAKLRENPYRLSAEIFRVGFLTTDRFARSLGVDLSSPYRVQAGLRHLLTEAAANGSCGLPQHELVEKGVELLCIDSALVSQGVEDCINANQLVQDTVAGQLCVFLPRLYRAEQFIAASLLARARSKPLASLEEAQRRIAAAEAACGIPLGEEQRAAVITAYRHRVSVITGGPGRGKTSCIRVLATALGDAGLELKLAAPTGKASKRLAEATELRAETIHLTLGANATGWTYNSENQLPTDVFIVDEFSMVDVPLAASVLAATPFDARLVIVGDKDQLPSVGPGRVFADLVRSGAVPVGLLQKTYRQAAGSIIIRAADEINAGNGLPEKDGADFVFIDKDDPAEIARTIVGRVLGAQSLGFDPMRDVQVLSPMRKSLVGTNALNEALRSALLPHTERYFKVSDFKSFREGDKVIQTKNNRALRVMNGDIGYVVKFDKEALTVEFDGIGLVHYPRSEVPQLELAYCITIHKSQGSEAPVVIMPVSASHFIMMQRNLLYTGMTRAKKLLVMVGQRWVAKKAAENAVVEDRHSMLLKLLRGG